MLTLYSRRDPFLHNKIINLILTLDSTTSFIVCAICDNTHTSINMCLLNLFRIMLLVKRKHGNNTKGSCDTHFIIYRQHPPNTSKCTTVIACTCKIYNCSTRSKHSSLHTVKFYYYYLLLVVYVRVYGVPYHRDTILHELVGLIGSSDCLMGWTLTRS